MFRWFNAPATETQITHGQRLWLYVLAVVTMILLVTPTLIVIPMSFSESQYLEFPPENWSTRWYENYFSSKEWMLATRTSFKGGVLNHDCRDANRGSGRLRPARVKDCLCAGSVCFADHADDGAGSFDRDWRVLCLCQTKDPLYDHWSWFWHIRFLRCLWF